MKKFFPRLFVLILLLASSLFAQQSLHAEDTATETWYFGSAVTVTWSFVNVIAKNPNGNAEETRYNAILTISNDTASDIQGWNFMMDEVDQITSLSGATLLAMPAGKNSPGSCPVYYIQDNSLSRNVIPAHGSLSINYSAIAKEGVIHKPASLIFSAHSVAFDSDLYND